MRSPRGVTFPSEGKGDGKVRPSGREDPPQGNAPPLRPCFLRQGRGMPLLSPDADGCKNAGVSGNGEVETGSFVKRKAIVFYFEYRAGIVFRKTIEQHPRGSGTEVSASMARDDCIVVTQRISPARSRGTDSSGSRGGAGATNEGKQKAFVPPPAGRAGRVPREDFEGSSHFPPAGSASRGGSYPPAAERVARLWAPPAPSRRASRGSAGGGFPGFADSTTWDRSATALEHLARNIEFRGSSRRFFRDYLPDTKILPPPDPRGCRALNPACLAPRATLAETPVSDPRGCRAIIFHDASPARCPK